MGDLVHLLQRVHRTETRKATEKVAMTDVRKEHQHFLLKVRQEKRTEYLAQTSRKGSCQRESSCNCWHVPDSTKFKAPGGGRFGDKCAYKHKAKLRMKRKYQYLLLNTFHRMMNDRCKYGKFSRMTSGTSSSCEQVRSERENWDLHLESSRLDLRISEILTRKRSIEWTPSMEEKTRKAACFFTQERVQTSRISVLRIRQTQVLQTGSREQCLCTRELHFLW